MKLGQATIKNFARELNLSASTISRALKDYPEISDEAKSKDSVRENELSAECHCLVASQKQVIYHWSDHPRSSALFLLYSHQRKAPTPADTT